MSKNFLKLRWSILLFSTYCVFVHTIRHHCILFHFSKVNRIFSVKGISKNMVQIACFWPKLYVSDCVGTYSDFSHLKFLSNDDVEAHSENSDLMPVASTHVYCCTRKVYLLYSIGFCDIQGRWDILNSCIKGNLAENDLI